MERKIRSQMTLTALAQLPEFVAGDDVVAEIWRALKAEDLSLEAGDVLVVAQKIISKSEGRLFALDTVEISDEAKRLARKIDKDPRLAQLILDESVEIIRLRRGVVIVEHRLGYVHANAGIDQSNIGAADEAEAALLLPRDPDASAASLRTELEHRSGVQIGVIISDSAGRPCREGVVGFAIGASGFAPLTDESGRLDRFDRPLQATSIAVADALAAAAVHLMGEAGEGVPVVLIRGARLSPGDQGARVLNRPKETDLFRNPVETWP